MYTIIAPDGHETQVRDEVIEAIIRAVEGKRETWRCGKVLEWSSPRGRMMALPAKPAEKEHRLTWPVTRESQRHGYTVTATAKGVKYYGDYTADGYTAWVTGWISGIDYDEWRADYNAEQFGYNWTQDALIRLIGDAATISVPEAAYRGPGRPYTEEPWLRIAPNGRFILYMRGGYDI